MINITFINISFGVNDSIILKYLIESILYKSRDDDKMMKIVIIDERICSYLDPAFISLEE